MPYQDAINYYERVVQRQGSLKKTQRFFRYFLVPGMGHCTGGPGINEFGQTLGTVIPQDSEHDILQALIKWVERGNAPDSIITSALDCCSTETALKRQRPIYPYPKFPEYIRGDPDVPSSYKARDHPRGGVTVPGEKYLK